jgi:hypothetical protein
MPKRPTRKTAKPHQHAPHGPDPSQQLFQLATAYVPNAALFVAAELDIAGLVANGPRPVAELARKTNTNEDALYRTLRLLAMLGIFTETQPRFFGLTPPADLLRADHPRSLRDTVIWMADPFHFRIAGELMHSVKTGQPTVQHVTGKPAFEYFASDPVELDRFHRAMTNLSAMALAPALEAYDFSPFKAIVDVGGGHGFAICSLLKKHPRMKGVLFDLVDIVPGAEHRIHEENLQARCRVEHGDFFQSVPEGGDLYFMKSIIHDWPDDRAQLILRNCRKALAGTKNGRVMLLEFVVPPANQPHPAKVIDIEMLFFPGGRERTEEEFRDLFAGAGLRVTRFIPTRSIFTIVEGEVAG